MKKMNNKGFTLVELLAVIVVLAIIMLIATRSVLPLVERSRKGAFASSANTVLDVAQTVQVTDQISSHNYKCYTIKYLIDNQYLEKMTNAEYSGIVIINKVTTSTGTTVTYNEYLYSGTKRYALNGGLSATKSTFVESDVLTDQSETTYTTCKAYGDDQTPVWTSGTDYIAET